MGGIEQREIDEILPLDEAADRRRRGDHEQRVAGIGIDDPVQRGRRLASGTATLASAGSVMLRITVSGCGGACTLSAKISVQLAPLERSSLVSECICGRLRRMRIACPLSSGMRLTSPMMAPPLARIGSTSSGAVESNTSQTVSPRRNEAAGVGAAKEKVRRRPSLSRQASTCAGSWQASHPARRRCGQLASALRRRCGFGAIFGGASRLGGRRRALPSRLRASTRRRLGFCRRCLAALPRQPALASAVLCDRGRRLPRLRGFVDRSAALRGLP